ncbi:hypothetical protein G9A89_000179 [Geosiphon pyriformis]|nr:hypothetical protein G9A89_000179 [Geosiphon pyriformis]
MITLNLALTSYNIVNAAPAPSPPDGSTTWTVGEKVTIAWGENADLPQTKDMSGITITLMTGADLAQIPLDVIASGLKVSTKSVDYVVPPLSKLGYPAGKIYFIMFSSSTNPSSGVSWSTRFIIVDGKTPTVTYDKGEPFTFSRSQGSSAPTSGVTTSDGGGITVTIPEKTTAISTTSSTTTSTSSSTTSTTSSETTTTDSSTASVVTVFEDSQPTEQVSTNKNSAAKTKFNSSWIFVSSFLIVSVISHIAFI